MQQEASPGDAGFATRWRLSKPGLPNIVIGWGVGLRFANPIYDYFNLLFEALRDALDPRLSKTRG